MAQSSLDATIHSKSQQSERPFEKKSSNWHRVVVYDADTDILLTRKKKKVDKEERKLKRIPLDRKKKEVSLWVDSETGTTLKGDKEKTKSDVFLVGLKLDHLGIVDKVLKEFGLLSWLYVSASWDGSDAANDRQ